MFPDLTRDDVFRLETRRLWLRWPCAADAEAIVDLAGDRAVSEMTARIPHPLDRTTVDGFIVKSRWGNTEGRSLVMAIAPRGRPQSLIGIVAIEPDPGAAGPHLGYWLGAAHWNNGLVTEAVGAMVEAFFAYTPGQVLTSAVRVENVASRRVLQKCGFAHEGSALAPFPARGGDFPVDRFRLDRRTWQRRNVGVGAAFTQRSVLLAVHA
ncbi:GNAT family N-acetyltransferase [Methylobacterium durans]|uniref:GNAT family N-acetyltransferase n=1 Tax=Methylobacterium durans TaxID=2202825 RepID=UPI002AFF8BF3|nr:GNAT family N-acetyltransferase [Methylobacterium durans]MEA1831777.1 GNAT family N-acetyltransferase [Methylobacterium durans]